MSRGSCGPASGLLMSAGRVTIIVLGTMSAAGTAMSSSKARTMANRSAFISTMLKPEEVPSGLQEDRVRKGRTKTWARVWSGHECKHVAPDAGNLLHCVRDVIPPFRPMWCSVSQASAGVIDEDVPELVRILAPYFGGPVQNAHRDGEDISFAYATPRLA